MPLDMGTFTRNLGMSVGKCSARLAIKHIGPSKDVNHILLLREKKSTSTTGNRNSQEIMQRDKILHQELLGQSSNNATK
jgi:high-affinity K+ transport system ATPase subunit B